jgi:hypothetical protein
VRSIEIVFLLSDQSQAGLAVKWATTVIRTIKCIDIISRTIHENYIKLN